jgi:hypothetical protein
MVPQIRGYTSWTAVNKTPAAMNPDVAVLCAPPPSAPNQKPVKGTQGPHAKKWINVFVNSQGANAMLTQKRPRFPVGTVIVKQKLPSVTSKGSKTEGAGITPELLTVMIKRAPNYNRSNGDWEYLVTNGAGDKVTAKGKLKSCQGCHRPYAKTDYVVRSYLPPSVFQALKETNNAMSKPK